ncbi:unnamed protein product [Ectocarpus fasciculatus]
MPRGKRTFSGLCLWDGYVEGTQTRGCSSSVKAKVPTLSKPDMSRGAEMPSVTFNARSINDHAALTGLRSIRSKDDVFKLLQAVGAMQPCTGVCYQHLVEDDSVTTEAAGAFRSLVRHAQRTLEASADMS